jgi:hypothetical protein
MDSIKEKTRRQYVLDWAWNKAIASGLFQTQRQAFNRGFDFGFTMGMKKAREDAEKARQTKIPGT